MVVQKITYTFSTLFLHVQYGSFSQEGNSFLKNKSEHKKKILHLDWRLYFLFSKCFCTCQVFCPSLNYIILFTLCYTLRVHGTASAWRRKKIGFTFFINNIQKMLKQNNYFY